MAAPDTEGSIDSLPAPREASGIAVGPAEPSAAWWIPRTLMYLPHLAVEAINAPIRGALYVSDRYQVIERAEDLLFNDARTFGVYPIASYATGFGISGGAKLVHRDLFGDRESLRLSALYGGRYNQEYSLTLDTGRRFSNIRAGFQAGYQRRPKERFFGIGNGDELEPSELTMPIDPLTSDAAVASRFRRTRYVAGVQVVGALDSSVFAGVRTLVARDTFGRSESLSGDAALEDVFVESDVLGFEDTLEASYSEIELRYDTRRTSSVFASAAMPSRGFLAAARAGYLTELDGERSGFFRFEADLQAYFDLYEGSRTLGLRFFAAQITEDVDDVAFIYLPRLGGDTLLRGYETDRFRDRGLMLGSVEYKFELNPRYLAGVLFVDAGRVQDSIFDPELDDLRVGFGGGLQVHTLESFLLRVHIASSIDGGVFLNLDFDPVSESRVRE